MNTASSRYRKYQTLRDGYLRRARECARYTMPHLFPPQGFNETSDLPTPFQALGARGVRNLASKLLLTLLPPNTPFMKLSLSSSAEEETSGTEGAFDTAFSRIERAAVEDLEATTIRVTMFAVLKQLLVAGNALLHFLDDSSIRVFNLTDYVVRRDFAGKVKEVILLRRVDPKELSLEVREACDIHTSMIGNTSSPGSKDDGKVDVYTHIQRGEKSWDIHQEINDKVVPGSEGSDPLDAPTWLPVRMITIDGEDYGRSYVEDVLGDLVSFDGMSKHILEGAAAMAKMLILRAPNASVSAKDLEKANLSVITGRPADVAVLQMDKAADFSVALQLTNDIKERLEHGFLLTTAIQRNAERVTAEEIRTMASELEDALGGIYSTLSQEIQIPLANHLLARLVRQKRFPQELNQRDLVNLTITTGLQALGRGHDLQRMRGFLQDLVSFSQSAEALPDLKRGEVILRLASSYGIETEGLVKTPDELAAEQQAAQEAAQQAQMMQMGSDAIKSGAATEMMKAATSPGE